MSPSERAAAYNAAFPKWPPLVVYGRWIYGVWEIGNDYRNRSPLYGAYPARFLPRLQALFPDHAPGTWLHAFAGSLPPDTHGLRVDRVHARQPDVVADVCQLPLGTASVEMVDADPPYGERHAKRYGTKMVNRLAATRELARVVTPGGHLAWLDTKKPMYRNTEWFLFGEIGVVRSTNHDVRMLFLFERQ